MTIKEGVLTGYNGTATTFVVPADVHTIENKLDINIYSNEKYKVASGNNWFTAVDGVLLSKDKKTLTAYPRNKQGKTYKVPAKTTTIGAYAFCASRNVEKVTLPKGLKTIGSIAFYNSNLKRVNIPKSVTYIGTQAFSKMKIKDITIDSKITSLEYELFADCSELESVVLPASLTSMSTDVFKNCKSLKDIYFLGTKEQWDTIDKTAAAIPAGVTMHYGQMPAK